MSILTAYDKFIQVALKYGFSLFGLPKTGQTTEYQDGDDGHYKKGYPLTGARFTDNGDGTITDNATGLMWVKDGAGAGCNGGTPLFWDAAIIFCEALNFAGHNDWRLPNAKETQSIMDYERYDPVIDPLFINTTGTYWTSTTQKANMDYAWYFDSYLGSIRYDLKYDETYNIRPVRGGA